MAAVLGLDLGPASLGWALVDEAECRLVAAGVRVFPEGVARDSKGAELSKNAQRRARRQARRQLYRRRQRRAQIKALLSDAGMWPTLEQMATADPYRLRARGLDEPLTLRQLGLAVAHLAKRRGFKSSRLGSTDESSEFYTNLHALQAAIDEKHRTLGEYLDHLRRSAGECREHLVRLRGRRTLRTMHEREFDAIWRAQQPHHPATLTDALRDKLRTVIFYQRPLKPWDEMVGLCELEPRERRCPAAHRAAQRFRMLAEVNNLRLIDARGMESPLPQDARAKLTNALAAREKMTFDQIRKALGLAESQRFNLENGKREYLWGNRTDHALRHKDLFGKRWDALDEATREAVVHAVLTEDDPLVLVERAVTEWGLSADAARELSALKLQRGYVGFSLKALRKLLPWMEAGMLLRSRDGEQSAMGRAGYLGRDQRTARAVERLPAPPEDLRNPIVLAALNQTKRLVNAVIAEYGRPSAIHVELAREAQGSIEERKERAYDNARRRKEREKAADAIRELAAAQGLRIAHPTRNDIERYRLWADQGETCPYTGEKIPQSKLFSSEYEVDHILPYSRTLDNSYNNKVLCSTRANSDKGQRSVWEWLGESNPERFEAVIQRTRHLWALGQGGKARKFAQKSCELDDFIARQLNDTGYITRQVAGYLGQLGIRVVCLRGQTTADLRWRWGLDGLLRDDRAERKAREDHRHHAVDAVVIALTDRSRLQALARLGKGDRRAEARLAQREKGGSVDKATGEVTAYPGPWASFRADVRAVIEAVNVSHRPRRRVSGELHQDTVYGPTGTPGEFVRRVRLNALSIDDFLNIRDRAVRAVVGARLREHGIDTGALFSTGRRERSKELKDAWDKAVDAAFATPLPMRTTEADPGRAPAIQRVRVVRSDLTIQPLDKAGARAVKPGSNHHVSIFETVKDKGKRVRVDVWTTRLEAARRAATARPLISRKHPDIPSARFLFALTPGDLVLADFGGGMALYRFKTGASTQGQLYFVNARDARKDSDLEVFVAKASTTSKYHVRPVVVDLLGRIRDRFTQAKPVPVDEKVALLAKAALSAGLSNTQAHKRLKAAGLGALGAQLTAILKRLRNPSDAASMSV